MKEKYERIDIELIRFTTADVLAATGEPQGTGNEDDLPFVPNN